MHGHLNVRFMGCLLATESTLMIRSRPICATCVNITELCIFRAVFSAILALLSILLTAFTWFIHVVETRCVYCEVRTDIYTQ